MPRLCTVCSHAERGEIDATLAGETSPNRRIATRYGLSEAAIRRHRRDHLSSGMVHAAEQEDIRTAIDVHRQLRDINAAVREVLEQAQKDHDGELALKASDRILKQLELQAKLLGELQDGNVVNVIVAPQWIELRAVILAALHPYPDAAQAVAGRLQMLEGGQRHAST